MDLVHLVPGLASGFQCTACAVALAVIPNPFHIIVVVAELYILTKYCESALSPVFGRMRDSYGVMKKEKTTHCILKDREHVTY